MESDIKKVVLEKLRSQSGLDIIREDDHLREDLGISSLGMMMILIDLEQVLSIAIDFSRLVNVKTAGQLTDAIVSMVLSS